MVAISVSSRPRAPALRKCHPDATRASARVEGPAGRRVGTTASCQLPSPRTAGPCTPRPPTRKGCGWKKCGRCGRDDTVLAVNTNKLTALCTGETPPSSSSVCRQSMCQPDRGLQPEWRDLLHSNPNSFHRFVTCALVFSSMRISSGQGRLKPSLGHLRVASTPIFEP